LVCIDKSIREFDELTHDLHLKAERLEKKSLDQDKRK